ncbi:MAG: hypothetical protein II039_15075 [Treponema sp.]|nr:hypothetical protein [Treponema sp.]
MEVKKRKHRRTKTAAQIKHEIELLKVELERKEQEERLKIGQKLQEWTGLETWDEIEVFLKRMSSKTETVAVTANLS